MEARSGPINSNRREERAKAGKQAMGDRSDSFAYNQLSQWSTACVTTIFHTKTVC